MHVETLRCAQRDMCDRVTFALLRLEYPLAMRHPYQGALVLDIFQIADFRLKICRNKTRCMCPNCQAGLKHLDMVQT